jgi:hypothetical protein
MPSVPKYFFSVIRCGLTVSRAKDKIHHEGAKDTKKR